MQCDNIISFNSSNQFPIDQLQQYKWIKSKKQRRKVHSTMSRNSGTTFPIPHFPLHNKMILSRVNKKIIIAQIVAPIVIRFDSIKLLKGLLTNS